MLVIISDLHLTDGTTGETINSGAFNVFRERLRDLAYDASWRADGKYKPIEEFDLILLGDIFDHICTTKWNEEEMGDPGYIRPWHNPQSETFINKIRYITDAILNRNVDSFKVLKSLNNGQTITLPPATQKSKPALVSRQPDSGQRQPVEVRIHYLVGNHDWFFHLPGQAYNQIRQDVINALGLVNSPDPFSHDTSPKLEALYEQHQVIARHGDIFDAFNYDAKKGRLAASLGDALVIELFNRFPEEVNRRMGVELPESFRTGLRELNNVSPSMVAPTWIDGLMVQSRLSRSQVDKIRAIWNELADGFLNLDFVRSQDTINPFDTVDLLEGVLKFSRGLSFNHASDLVTWIQQKGWGGDTSYTKQALAEETIKAKKAKAVVYGHTHFYEVVPLDAGPTQSGKRFDQLYINSGTWHAIHKLAQRDPKAGEFVSYKVMTYLAFYKDDERRGRSFEAWSGILDH